MELSQVEFRELGGIAYLVARAGSGFDGSFGPFARVTIEDDNGALYRAAATCGWSAAHGLARYEARFTPHPPPDAHL